MPFALRTDWFGNPATPLATPFSIVTNSKAKQATIPLIDQGADVIMQDVDAAAQGVFNAVQERNKSGANICRRPVASRAFDQAQACVFK